MEEELWQAIINCDSSYDGKFFYGVVTTGIFCRPSCKSRAPKRTNVRIFQNQQEAEAAKLRACKRCRPDLLRSPEEEMANRVQQMIETNYAEPLSLATIAEALHVSSFHLHHLFKRVTGKTPAVSLLEHRLATAKSLLTDSEQSITEIAGAVGIPNMAYFATVFKKHVGMSPSDYRNQARAGEEGLGEVRDVQ